MEKAIPVFKNFREEIYYVIETKWIDHHRNSNMTVKKNNQDKRRYVKVQARRYGMCWAAKHPGKVVNWYAIINDKSGEPEILEKGRVLTK